MPDRAEEIRELGKRLLGDEAVEVAAMELRSSTSPNWVDPRSSNEITRAILAAAWDVATGHEFSLPEAGPGDRDASDQVPEEAVEIASAAWFEAESDRKWEEAKPSSKDLYRDLTGTALAAALPSLIDHTRERLLSDEAVDADAHARWLGEPNEYTREQSRRGLLAALTAAFPGHNTDSKEAEDGDE